jgi:hypothetical protein
MSESNGNGRGQQAAVQTPAAPAQPDQQYVIATLMEENQQLNANKLYLLAMLKQMQAEYREAEQLWALEKASLTKSAAN